MAITTISSPTAIMSSIAQQCPMKPTWKFMAFSFPKMEEIAFRRNPQGTSKREVIAQVRKLRNKARKGGHK